MGVCVSSPYKIIPKIRLITSTAIPPETLMANGCASIPGMGTFPAAAAAPPRKLTLNADPNANTITTKNRWSRGTGCPRMEFEAMVMKNNNVSTPMINPQIANQGDITSGILSSASWAIFVRVSQLSESFTDTFDCKPRILASVILIFPSFVDVT